MTQEDFISWTTNTGNTFYYGKYNIAKYIDGSWSFGYLIEEKVSKTIFTGTRTQCFSYAHQYFNNPANNKVDHIKRNYLK